MHLEGADFTNIRLLFFALKKKYIYVIKEKLPSVLLLGNYMSRFADKESLQIFLVIVCLDQTKTYARKYFGKCFNKLFVLVFRFMSVLIDAHICFTSL